MEVTRAKTKISLHYDKGSDRGKHRKGSESGGGDPGLEYQRTRGSEADKAGRGWTYRMELHGARMGELPGQGGLHKHWGTEMRFSDPSRGMKGSCVVGGNRGGSQPACCG